MAYNRLHSSLLPTFFILAIIPALTVEASAGRVIHESSENTDEKQPEWFFGSDGGTGGFPLPFSSGNFGGSGGGSNGGYLPGGDDTFVPTPGFEIPNTGSGGGNLGPAPAPANP